MIKAEKIFRNFVRIQKNEHGVVIFETEGELPDIGFLSIRAGLSWPNKSAPGYFCLLGQRTSKNARGRNPLVFLVEGEANDPQELFRRLTDEAARFYCENIYVDLSESWKGFEDLFDDYGKENEIKGIYLKDAPYRENFQLGLAVIRKWISENALDVESGTILAEQLGKIPRGELGKHPEIGYYAINGLRFVIGSYEIDGGRGGMTVDDVRRLQRLYSPSI